ncbi:MAG: hypothetical protein AAFW70_30190 [Cyanobacteria bacterium J06635_10]
MKRWLNNLIGNVDNHPNSDIDQNINEHQMDENINENINEKENDDYKKRLEQEIENYNQVENIHDLPQSFHYISNKYLGNIIEEIIGFSNFRDFCVHEINQYSSQSDDIIRIASIGSGNSDEELRLCQQLASRNQVIFDCFSINW